MSVITFIFNRQVQIGLLFAVFLFMPWKQKREHFGARLLISMLGFAAITELFEYFDLDFRIKLLLYTVLIAALILVCFQCSLIHDIYCTTCTYAVQHASSKIAFLIIMPFRIRMDIQGIPFMFWILTVVSVLVWMLVFKLYTRPYSQKEDLQFDNGKVVKYSGIFILAAIYLSVALENGLDATGENYLSSYLSLNALCVLFSFTILTLEINNYNTKALEQENLVLTNLLKADKQQYEQAQKDMEKINIRYHDLKQQYSKAGDEERRKLEEEMAELNLSYFTGNKAVDITLTQKASRCNEEEIRLICSVDGTCLNRMKHFHIFSMLGNALDNAIECLEQVAEPDRKVITLDIHKEKNMAVIRVENFTPKNPVFMDQTIVTSKADTQNHGYGVKSIQNTAEIYGGVATTFVEDHIFYLIISLPLYENAISK
ncbi:MAG: ATP-binding protein [Lachnospiraceae bacterium]|nr:ATP-binding protein [Lachnospiraceae bacterium]